MKLTRRGFLGLLSTGIVGACVVSKLPTAWIPEPIRRHAALEFMRKQYNDWVDARRKYSRPDKILLGQDLYDAFEADLTANMRFCSSERTGIPTHDMPTHFMFKATPVFEDMRAPLDQKWRMTIQSGKDLVISQFKPVYMN